MRKIAEEHNVVDRILADVLPFLDYDHYSHGGHTCSPIKCRNDSQQGLFQYDPKTHAIITKDQLNLAFQQNGLTNVIKQLNDLHHELSKLHPNITATKSGVDFIVSRYTKQDDIVPKTESGDDVKLRLKTKWATPRK